MEKETNEGKKVEMKEERDGRKEKRNVEKEAGIKEERKIGMKGEGDGRKEKRNMEREE